MAQSSIPLTSLTEAQRAQAQKRFTIIRPALEDGITQAQVARTHNIPAPTVRRWMKRYRDNGLAGLADAATRSDKGKSRRLPPDAIPLIVGLALQKPQRSMAAIHRQVVTIAEEQGWKPPSSLSERTEQQSMPAIPSVLSLEWRVRCRALRFVPRIPGAELWSFQLPREVCRPSQGNGLGGC